MPRKSTNIALDRSRILEAATAVAARDGFDQLSMRAIGAELGVEAMSLYHWFPSKAHLLDGLLDRFVASLEISTVGTPGDRLRGGARSFRRAAGRNAALFGWLARHRFNTRTALGQLDPLLAVFHDAGLDDAAAASAFRFYVHWLVGFCLDETQGYGRGPSAVDPVPADEIARDFPHVARLGPFNAAEHHDAQFDWALDRVIAAILGTRAPATG